MSPRGIIAIRSQTVGRFSSEIVFAWKGTVLNA
jgi:hypothetical protein